MAIYYGTTLLYRGPQNYSLMAGSIVFTYHDPVSLSSISTFKTGKHNTLLASVYYDNVTKEVGVDIYRAYGIGQLWSGIEPHTELIAHVPLYILSSPPLLHHYTRFICDDRYLLVKTNDKLIVLKPQASP